MEYQNQKPCLETDTIALEIERFSSLSSEMVLLLENLKREINRSALELQDVQAAVNAGKQELEALRKSKKEALDLERQIEDLRQQQETLERLIADQQSIWEEEKTKQSREARGYEENLKTLRQREEEEHRLILENEQMSARQKFEEELDAMRQKSAGMRAAEEKDILAGESAINKKEQELGLLMQELEKFLSGLAVRAGTAAQSDRNASSSTAPGYDQGMPVFLGMQDEFKSGFNPGNALMWGEEGEEGAPGSENRESLFGKD